MVALATLLVTAPTLPAHAAKRPPLANQVCAKAVLGARKAKPINAGKRKPTKAQAQKITRCIQNRAFEAVAFYIGSLECHAAGISYHYTKDGLCKVYNLFVNPSGPDLPWPPPNWMTQTASFKVHAVRYLNSEAYNRILAIDSTGGLSTLVDNAVQSGWTQATFTANLQLTTWWLSTPNNVRVTQIRAASGLGDTFWPVGS